MIMHDKLSNVATDVAPGMLTKSGLAAWIWGGLNFIADNPSLIAGLCMIFGLIANIVGMIWTNKIRKWEAKQRLAMLREKACEDKPQAE